MLYGRDDMVAWAYEKSDIFTVKSAYRLAMNEKRGSDGMEGSSVRPMAGWAVYQALWKADVPP
jgi:hypothetical protein